MREHGGDIVNVGDDNSHKCRMCYGEFAGIGFKCTICLASFYCIECRKLDADMKRDDGTTQSIAESLTEQSLKDALISLVEEQDDI